MSGGQAGASGSALWARSRWSPSCPQPAPGGPSERRRRTGAGWGLRCGECPAPAQAALGADWPCPSPSACSGASRGSAGGGGPGCPCRWAGCAWSLWTWGAPRQLGVPAQGPLLQGQWPGRLPGGSRGCSVVMRTGRLWARSLVGRGWGEPVQAAVPHRFSLSPFLSGKAVKKRPR